MSKVSFYNTNNPLPFNAKRINLNEAYSLANGLYFSGSITSPNRIEFMDNAGSKGIISYEFIIFSYISGGVKGIYTYNGEIKAISYYSTYKIKSGGSTLYMLPY